MDFGFALKAIKEGRSISRIDWPSSRREWTEDGNQRLRTEQYLYLISGTDLSGLHDEDQVFTPTICLHTSTGKSILGWTPSQEDMLSTDWFVLETK